MPIHKEVLAFYDELFDVICESVECGVGSYQ
jgi:hypothetical protein